MRMRLAATAAGALAALVTAAPGEAQTPQVRLAAPSSCPGNVNCIPGLKRVYGISTIRDGSYPAIRPIGVVTVGRPAGALRRFLRWAQTSRTARRVIATRYVPIARAR